MHLLGNLRSELTVAILAVCLVLPVEAVVVSTTTENTTAPENNPGWENAVIVRGSSGTYLGNRWVLTAAHVAAGTVVIGEDVYAPEPGSTIQLSNPGGQGLTPLADLIMFRIEEDPGLPSLRLSVETPDVGTNVVMIGRGRNRTDEGQFWRVTGAGQNFVWAETNFETTYFGWPTLDQNDIRWGTNLVESDDLVESQRDRNNVVTISAREGDTITVVTEFDGGTEFESDDSIVGLNADPATEFESQAVRNDSGGPLFFQQGGEWILGGIMLAVDGFEDQPDVRENAIYGNLTFTADISQYRREILQHYIRGDFDDDGVLNAGDIDLLTSQFQMGLNSPVFDLNRDEKVDQDDREFWIESIRRTDFGDANLDGIFNTTDLVEVFEEGQYEDQVDGNSTWATGDWNGDSDFTTSDFVLALQKNGYQNAALVNGVVPEPQNTGLVWLMFIIVAAKRRKIKHP